MDSMLQIGGASEEDLQASAAAIVRVLAASPFPEVQIAALETLGRLVTVKNVTVRDCTFTNQPSKSSSEFTHMKYSVPVMSSDFKASGDR